MIKLNEQQIERHNTLIHLCCFDTKLHYIKQVLKDIIDINYVNALGRSAFINSITGPENRKPDIARLLIEYGADVNQKDPEGQTPLMIAARHNAQHTQIAELLLKNNADINVKDYKDKTPLMFTIKEPMTKLLIKHGAKIHAVNNNGESFLLMVCNNQFLYDQKI